MAFHSPDPAALRHDDGDRLALDHRFQGDFARRAGFLDSRAAAAKLGFRSVAVAKRRQRSEEHTSELQSLMRISYAVFCLKKKKQKTQHTHYNKQHYYKLQ